jgi:hypothetical protein
LDGGKKIVSKKQVVKWVLIQGHKPVYGKAMNNFLASLDLGISGAYMPHEYYIKLTFNSDPTPKDEDRLLQELEQLFATDGWVDVKLQIFDEDKTSNKDTKSMEQ